MPDIYYSPGVGLSTSPFQEQAIGFIVIETPSEVLQPFLIQDYSLVEQERFQENYTQSETKHLYTFGKNIARLRVNGYFLNSNTRGVTTGNATSGGRVGSNRVLSIWENEIRAKKAGEASTTTTLITISPLDVVLLGVPVSLSISSSVSTEALLQASLEFLIMNELNDVVV